MDWRGDEMRVFREKRNENASARSIRAGALERWVTGLKSRVHFIERRGLVWL